MITLKRPIKEYESKAVAFKQEFIDNGETTINGSELLDQMDSYDEWLRSVTANTSPDTVNPSWVVTDTYFAFDENDSKRKGRSRIPCDEEGNIRSSIKIPGKNEIYAQIAFQEQFYSGVLVGL